MPERNLLNLSDPLALWETWGEPQPERVTYHMSAVDYSLSRWVLFAAWATGKPSQLPAVTMYAEHAAQIITTQRIEQPNPTSKRSEVLAA